MRPLLLLLATLLIAPAPALAKKKKDLPTRADAERQILTTHRAYAAAVIKTDWMEAATYFDPAALTGIRETITPFFAMDDGEGQTIGVTMVGKTTEELAALDDSAFFGAFVSGIIAMNPGVGEAMAQAQMLEKGVAFGDPGEAYVVYEMSLNSNGVDMTKFAVTPMVRRDDGTWALKMTGEFEGMAEAFARMADEEKARQAAEAEATKEAEATQEAETTEPSETTE